MKFCIDCKHHTPVGTRELHDQCARTSKATKEPVRGRDIVEVRSCETERLDFPKFCGPDGKFFEDKVK